MADASMNVFEDNLENLRLSARRIQKLLELAMCFGVTIPPKIVFTELLLMEEFIKDFRDIHNQFGTEYTLETDMFK